MNDKRNIIKRILLLSCVVLILLLAIWGPEHLANYRDKNSLDKVIIQTVEESSEGYQYALNVNEKVYILSACLSNHVEAETQLSEKTKVTNELEYDKLNGTYALVTNYQGPTDKEIQESEVFDTFNSELETLKQLGIMPQEVKSISAASYSAELLSAIDVREPRNNVSVWKISLETSQVNADKSKRILDAYVDAQTGKVYEFYVRVDKDWSQLEPEEIVKRWSEYLGLEGREIYETDNPLLETTPYYLKYCFPGTAENSTIVTIGFYEGINELFLKISR